MLDQQIKRTIDEKNNVISTDGKIFAVVTIIEKELGKNLFLQRYPFDRTCPGTGLSGGKMGKKDILQAKNNFQEAIKITAQRENEEETGYDTELKDYEIVGEYDGHSPINDKAYHTFVLKVAQTSGKLKSFSSEEHKKALLLTPEEYIKHRNSMPITRQIIADYYDIDLNEMKYQLHIFKANIAQSIIHPIQRTNYQLRSLLKKVA